MTPYKASETTWLVEQARNPTETVRAIERACREQNLPLAWVPQVPFAPEIPDIDAAFPFVFYGYTTLIVNAWRDARFRRGVFYDPDAFCPSAYQTHWGSENMVTPFAFAPLSALHLWWSANPGARLFVKPNDDLKRFSGGIMTFAEFEPWFGHVKNLEGDVSSDTVVAYAPPAPNLGPEFRVFMVEGKAVAASSYLPHGGVPPPSEVLKYAEARACDWQPAPVFVLDVAYLIGETKSSLRIVEANCFNGSAFYRADAGAIVRAVSACQAAQKAG